MRNVQLSGKGILVEYLFSVLSKSYPDSVWVEPKKKWYHAVTRHQLTIPSLTPEQVVDLGQRLESIGVPVTLTLS